MMSKIAITFSMMLCLSACNSFVMHRPGFVSSEVNWRQKDEVMRNKHVPTYLRSNFLYSPLHAKPEDELYEAEEAAAFDAHDVSDPGMEGAAMERSVMMAQEMFAGEKKRSHEAHVKAEEAAHKSDTTDVESEPGEVDELFEAEEAAAVDAHDVSDPGMEGAAMERSVVMAQELFAEEKKHHMEESEKAAKESNAPDIISASESEPDEVDEIYEAEEAAAFDAHDISDPGMEGAAMERAVFLAQELIAKKRKDAAQNKEEEKVSQEHINVIESAAENLAQMIDSTKQKKEDPEDYLALIEEADQEELALLLLERAVMNAAIRAEEKAEKAAAAAVEAKKFAAAFARRASDYAERKRKQALADGSDAKAPSDHDISSVASHLAADAEYQLQLANDAEEKARRQEAEAKGSLEQIVEKETELKADLKELHDLTHEETDQS